MTHVAVANYDDNGDNMINKYLGSLFGLAIGDALGAPVEFLSLKSIKEQYGGRGIIDFHEWGGFKAGSYTDDTQMALATAKGCIRYLRNRNIIEHAPRSVAYKFYLKWLETQKDSFNFRAPGNTCLRSLISGRMGTIEIRINNSKGCGGVMRTAPVGLIFPTVEAFQMGAEFGAITHGHPSGYLPAGYIAELVAWLIEGKGLIEAVEHSKERLRTYNEHEEVLEKIELAQELAMSDNAVEECISIIGEGWVGEEALGISLYCSLKYPGNLEKGMVAAVNHSGDSDSTGAITGAILGTLNGIEGIPNRWVREVEDSKKIKRIAEEMYEIRYN